MRTKALTLRILNQIRHDKRTMALIVVAPLLILTIIFFILGSGDNFTYKIGIVNAPNAFVTALNKNNEYTVETKNIKSGDEKEAIKSGNVIATASVNGSNIKIKLDGSNATKSKKIKAIILSAALANTRAETTNMITDTGNQLKAIMPTFDLTKLKVPSSPILKTDFVYGNNDASFFDNYGASLVGIIIFFLVFIIAGINFLGERTSGTLEKLLSTPIRRHEIITGYVLGFGVLAILQSLLVTFFIIYVLKMSIAGSIGWVLLINLLTAIMALTLGMVFSTMANSEFQMVQFIPVVILPQVFLCGLFDLTGGWAIAGFFMPLHYTTDALTKVMLYGKGIETIWIDLLVLIGICILCMMVNAILLKKMRKV